MSSTPGRLALPAPDDEVSSQLTPPANLVVEVLPSPQPVPSALQPLGAAPTFDFNSLVENMPGQVTVENLSMQLVQQQVYTCPQALEELR